MVTCAMFWWPHTSPGTGWEGTLQEHEYQGVGSGGPILGTGHRREGTRRGEKSLQITTRI